MWEHARTEGADSGNQLRVLAGPALPGYAALCTDVARQHVAVEIKLSVHHLMEQAWISPIPHPNVGAVPLGQVTRMQIGEGPSS